MERALDPGLLGLALAGQEGLPTPEEFSGMISEAEIGLLLRSRERLPSELESTAWYLHGVASTLTALDRYGSERRGAAFRVSAHVFDVLLAASNTPPLAETAPTRDPVERARWAFASAVGYRRSGLDPNADAIYKRVADDLRSKEWQLFDSHDRLACLLGLSVLAVDARTLFPLTDRLIEEASVEAARFDQADLRLTPLAALDSVVRGVRALLVFMIYGRESQLEVAVRRFSDAVRDESSVGDYATRWVAAHLIVLSDGLRSASVWTSLPPETPLGLKNVLAKGTPRVTSFWPPQLEALNITPSPLAESAKRAILGMPTSAGKTLFSQVVVLNHLLTAGTGVAFVAPTRSLCNEVRASLEARLQMLDFTVTSELPVRGSAFDLLGYSPDVEVMTPERLHGLLRQDAAGVLDRFGLFVFDEVHNVSDETRGWNLEETIAFLHAATSDSEHRLLLMSAALGNQTKFAQWMDVDGMPAVSAQSDWRAPRRLHCVWTTTKDSSSEAIEQIRSRTRPLRWRYDLYGRLIAQSRPGSLVTLNTEEPVGVLSLEKVEGRFKRDGGRSTPNYLTLRPLVEFLESTGPVLVIQATRPSTLWTAKALAENRTHVEIPELDRLGSLVETRLGPEHPLLDVLRRGVGYHHGALPLDIREALEEAVRDGYLRVLVATTTLTEGINLPVKSVIVASLGAWNSSGYEEFIVGAKLINAIGRAGRATQETEGIVVLGWNQQFDPSVFNRLDPPADDLEAHSLLMTVEGLSALADFEELQNRAADALLTFDEEPFASVLASLWFVQELTSRTGEGLSGVASSIDFLRKTLAWAELSASQQERLVAVADAVRLTFENTPAHLRRRWARAGSSIPTAVVLSELSDEIAQLDVDEDETPSNLILRLLDDGRLERALSVAEAPRVAAFSARGGRRTQLDVPLVNVLRDWMTGFSIGALGEAYLADVRDPEYRAEQIAALTSELFEQYLPWTLSILLEWSNETRGEMNRSLLPDELPMFVRWGVDSSPALELILNGVRSREAASAISRKWQDTAEEGQSLRDWLGLQELPQLRSELDLTSAELIEVLRYLRDRSAGLLSAVMAGRTGFVPLPFAPDTEKSGTLRVDPRDLVVDVLVDGEKVGSIPPQLASDVLTLVALDLTMQVTLRPGTAGMEVRLGDVRDTA